MRNPGPVLLLVAVTVALAGLFTRPSPAALPQVGFDRGKVPVVDRVEIGMSREAVCAALRGRLGFVDHQVNVLTPETTVLLRDESVWWITGKALMQKTNGQFGIVLRAGDSKSRLVDTLGAPQSENRQMMRGATSFGYVVRGRGLFVVVRDQRVESIQLCKWD